METEQFAESFRQQKKNENIPFGGTRIGVHTSQSGFCGSRWRICR